MSTKSATEASVSEASPTLYKPFVQALLLHATLRVPLQPQGEEDLRRVRHDSDFRAKVETTIDAMSAPNRFGIQIMSVEQAELVRGLLTAERELVGARR